VKKVGNKTMFSKETVECLHIVFWPGSHRGVLILTAKLEPNRKITSQVLKEQFVRMWAESSWLMMEWSGGLLFMASIKGWEFLE
jgi:hypothetical protein